MNITDDIKYIGVNDHDIDLFEGQYIVPNGMAYNSYVILDEKIAVMDTVDINFKEAAKWYLKAANQGFTEAQYNIGAMLYEGEGVEQNYKEAFNWFLKAANSGNVNAQRELGSMYINGKGVVSDFDQAVYWFKKGAEQGDYDCKATLKLLGY